MHSVELGGSICRQGCPEDYSRKLPRRGILWAEMLLARDRCRQLRSRGSDRHVGLGRVDVTDMQSMFDGAVAFNADISKWNTMA
mmetsp:Transcript_44850/g.72011  ORF Transcript_44850/g.72011 Transcript_44850/m.72011 type:complete len:84 (-) Transcript_44850:1690-1941(-)